MSVYPFAGNCAACGTAVVLSIPPNPNSATAVLCAPCGARQTTGLRTMHPPPTTPGLDAIKARLEAGYMTKDGDEYDGFDAAQTDVGALVAEVERLTVGLRRIDMLVDLLKVKPVQPDKRAHVAPPTDLRIEPWAVTCSDKRGDEYEARIDLYVLKVWPAWNHKTGYEWMAGDGFGNRDRNGYESTVVAAMRAATAATLADAEAAVAAVRALAPPANEEA